MNLDYLTVLLIWITENIKEIATMLSREAWAIRETSPAEDEDFCPFLSFIIATYATLEMITTTIVAVTFSITIHFRIFVTEFLCFWTIASQTWKDSIRFVDVAVDSERVCFAS